MMNWTGAPPEQTDEVAQLKAEKLEALSPKKK